ncbi:MAG: hypothetical protein IKC48_03770 [Clostridia bacterium]|nr:hypothetical protein [Clostridia bacterium]
MGLFSHKYNNKDFAKNSQLMSESIQRILMKIGSMQVGGAGKVLNQAMMQLQQMEYPMDSRGRAMDGKEIAPIDERIFKMLDKIAADCQQGSAESIAVHANMLYSAIMHSRINGKEKYSKNFLAFDEARADTLAQMCDAFKQIAHHNEAMQRALDRAKEAAPGSYEYQRAKAEYMTQQSQLQTVQATVATLQGQYNNLVDQIGLLNEVEAIQKMPEPPKTGAQLASWVADSEAIIARKNEQIFTDNEIMADTRSRRQGAAAAAANDGFDAMVQESKAQDMQNQIANSTGSLSSRNSAADEFDALVNGRR